MNTTRQKFKKYLKKKFQYLLILNHLFQIRTVSIVKNKWRGKMWMVGASQANTSTPQLSAKTYAQTAKTKYYSKMNETATGILPKNNNSYKS